MNAFLDPRVSGPLSGALAGALARARPQLRVGPLTEAALRVPAVALLAMALLLAPAALSAQEPLTYEEARVAMDAAEAESRANGWNLTIVISDADGVPLYLRRFGGATPRSWEIATGKIRTVLTTGMSTGEYAAALEDGSMEPIEGGVTFEGGYPIRRDGQVIGAMSASGARGSEDAQVVRAGLAAIGLDPG